MHAIGKPASGIKQQQQQQQRKKQKTSIGEVRSIKIGTLFILGEFDFAYL